MNHSVECLNDEVYSLIFTRDHWKIANNIERCKNYSINYSTNYYSLFLTWCVQFFQFFLEMINGILQRILK